VRRHWRIAGAVLFIAVCFLAAQIDAWLSDKAAFGDVFDGIVLTTLAGGVFYLAGRG
jgi:hypothetical protein